MTSAERDVAEFRRALASNLTTAEAAELCGMSPSAFRTAMTRERARGTDFDYRVQRRPMVLWSEARLRAWLASRPGKGWWR